ncbi:MAG: hypothetical protein ACO2PM_26140 [Pyrobaculum sp.]|jgi:hypothetical protein
MSTETVRVPAYAEGTIIKLGEGKVAIYINKEFKGAFEGLIKKRVRVLVIEVIEEEPRRRHKT